MTMMTIMVVDSIIDENKFEETNVAVVHADTDTDALVFAIMGVVVVALLVVADNNGLSQSQSKSVTTTTQPAAVSTTIGHSFSNHFF